MVEINTDPSEEYVKVPTSAITRAITIDRSSTNAKSAPDGAAQVTIPGLGHNQMPTKLTLSTYEDENGDPCSAV